MQRYLKNTIFNLQTPVTPWSRPRSTSLFWAFFLGMVYIFVLEKISPEWDRLLLFCTFQSFLQILSMFHGNWTKFKQLCNSSGAPMIFPQKCPTANSSSFIHCVFWNTLQQQPPKFPSANSANIQVFQCSLSFKELFHTLSIVLGRDD